MRGKAIAEGVNAKSMSWRAVDEKEWSLAESGEAISAHRAISALCQQCLAQCAAIYMNISRGERPCDYVVNNSHPALRPSYVVHAMERTCRTIDTVITCSPSDELGQLGRYQRDITEEGQKHCFNFLNFRMWQIRR